MLTMSFPSSATTVAKKVDNDEQETTPTIAKSSKCTTNMISTFKDNVYLKQLSEEEEDIDEFVLLDLVHDEQDDNNQTSQRFRCKLPITHYDGDEEDDGDDDDDDDHDHDERGNEGQPHPTMKFPSKHNHHLFCIRSYSQLPKVSCYQRRCRRKATNSPLSMDSYMKINQDEDKDSLVGTSATDDEYDLTDSSRLSSSFGGVASNSSIGNKQTWTVSRIDRNNNNNNNKVDPMDNNIKTRTPSPLIVKSDIIESDHYYITSSPSASSSSSSTKGSNDNLTFSLLPPLSGAKILTLGESITSITNDMPMIQKPTTKLDEQSPISKTSSKMEHHHPHRSSTSMASIRDAVSHLTRLDDFNVVKLSQGFFSQVFKVTHLPTGKIMVLKMNKNAGNRGNALKEIELLNKLNHPNIVAYMGTVVHEGALHPLLEYINGGTLEQLINKYYPSNKNPEASIANAGHYFYPKVSSPKVHRLKNVDRTFMSLMQDVCRGMAYLHSNGYLHRDLASKNIFIRKHMPNENSSTKKCVCQSTTIPVPEQSMFFFDNNNHHHRLVDNSDNELFDDNRLEAVIGDFGFATAEPSPQHKLSIVGSPYWLGPECLKNKWYNHKCDIFSFGVICCELNWRTPSDPDFLPRCDNYGIDFQKLSGKKDTLLGKVAMLACQYEPEKRPEFHELLTIFNDELLDFEESGQTNKKKCFGEDRFLYSYSPLPPQLLPNHHPQQHTFPKATFKRFNSLDETTLAESMTQPQSIDGEDVFEQHLRRRRHSALINCHNLATLSLMMDWHNGR